MQVKSRWTLPQTVHPAKYRRFVICVPDERYYIAAFQGLLIELTYSKNWQRDSAHTAAIVTRLWQEALANITCEQECPIIIDESDYEMSVCEQLRFHNGKLQGYCCGEWVDIGGFGGAVTQGASQPGAGGVVPLGECRETDIVLSGNDQAILPWSVQAGDTIEISAAVGGWTGGTVNWYCPDGTPYVLGACVGSGGTSGGDPLPSVDHMRLIAQYATAWVDAYNQTITIPDGTVETQLLFQANDSVLTDNHGSISFHVKYCRAEVQTWCAVYNAANGWAGWAGVAQGGYTPTLTGGVWTSVTDGTGTERLLIQILGLTLPTGSAITDILFAAYVTDTNPGSVGVDANDASGGHFTKRNTVTGNRTIDLVGLNITDGPMDIVAINNGISGAGRTTISSVMVSGTGPTPSWAATLPC